MKTIMTAVLGLSMLAFSGFAAQDAPKTAPKTDSTKSTTPKVKKHKKSVKSTTPAVAAAPASK
jgi:hypothetical protein